MSYETFRYIFIIGLVICCVMLFVSVVLFFALNIPKIISDLSGRTAKKAIEGIREQNEQSGNKSYQGSQVNRERGKLTDKISPSGRIVSRNPSSQLGYSVETAKIVGVTQETSVIGTSNETSVLSQDAPEFFAQNETSVLSPNEAGSCAQQSMEPAFVAGETSVLSENSTSNDTAVAYSNHQSASDFYIEFEITYVHTNEVIDAGGV